MHFLVRGFAAEHECAEDVADFRAYISNCDTVDRVEDRYLAVKQLRLVLGEMADFDVVAYLERPRERNLVENTFDERRLALAVLADKGHFLAALDGERPGAVEDLMVAVCLADVVGDYRMVKAERGRRRGSLRLRCGCVGLVDLYALYFGELLHAALNLHGLGGLISEPFDKLLGVGNLFLLVGIGAHLLLDAFLAQLDIFPE